MAKNKIFNSILKKVVIFPKIEGNEKNVDAKPDA